MKAKYGLRQATVERNFFSWLFPLGFISWAIVCMSYATQIIANAYRYDPRLGSPIFRHFYWPWKVFEWQSLLTKSVSNKVDMILGVFGLVSVVFFIFLLKKKPKANTKLHGTATWAEQKELKDMGLEEDEGVYVGGFPVKNGTKYLIHNGPEHILAFAPTRSGKGVGLVIPSLLIWKGSSITLDIKGENYALTAGYKAKIGHKTLRFDPADESHSSARWNPLSEIRLSGSQAIADAQNIAQMICDPDGKGMKDYFTQAGYAFLTGLILHTIVVKRNAALSDVVAQITKSDNDGDIKNLLYAIMDEDHKNILMQRFPTMDNSYAENIKNSIDSYAGEAVIKADRELSGVVSTAITNLSLYRDPTVAQNTSVSDFAISDLMGSEQPVDLYLVVSVANLDRLRPLLRVFFNLALRKMTEKLEFKEGKAVAHYKHRLLLMLDEFTSLGKLEIIEKALAFMAGYGIKAYVIVQDLSQLHKEYTKEESITSNCHVRLAYAPNKPETARLLSEMTGKTTVVDKKISVSGDRIGSMRNASIQMNEVARPLLTPDECSRLKAPLKDGNKNIIAPGDMLIFVAGHNPIYGQQMLFFEDEELLKRTKIEAP